MPRTLEEIFAERPSVIRSTLFIWLVKFISIVLMILFFAMGLGLIIMPEILFELIEKIMVGNYLNFEPSVLAQVKRLMYFFGILFLCGGTALSLLIYFANLVLVRNSFILDLDMHFYEQEQKSQQL